MKRCPLQVYQWRYNWRRLFYDGGQLEQNNMSINGYLGKINENEQEEQETEAGWLLLGLLFDGNELDDIVGR